MLPKYIRNHIWTFILFWNSLINPISNWYGLKCLKRITNTNVGKLSKFMEHISQLQKWNSIDLDWKIKVQHLEKETERQSKNGYYILQQFRICPENGGTEMHTGCTQMTITFYTSQLLSCEFSFYSDYSNLQITYNSLQLQFSPTGQQRHLCPSIEYLHTHRNQSWIDIQPHTHRETLNKYLVIYIHFNYLLNKKTIRQLPFPYHIWECTNTDS